MLTSLIFLILPLGNPTVTPTCRPLYQPLITRLELKVSQRAVSSLATRSPLKPSAQLARSPGMAQMPSKGKS